MDEPTSKPRGNCNINSDEYSTRTDRNGITTTIPFWCKTPLTPVDKHNCVYLQPDELVVDLGWEFMYGCCPWGEDYDKKNKTCSKGGTS